MSLNLWTGLHGKVAGFFSSNGVAPVLRKYSERLADSWELGLSLCLAAASWPVQEVSALNAPAAACKVQRYSSCWPSFQIGTFVLLIVTGGRVLCLAFDTREWEVVFQLQVGSESYFSLFAVRLGFLDVCRNPKG